MARPFPDSTTLPLAARPLDRAAHRRGDAAWIDAAFERPDALVCLLDDGQPVCAGPPGSSAGEAAGLFWMGAEAARLGPHLRIFLGEDKAGAPVFALALERGLEGTLVEGAAHLADMRAVAGALPALEANLASTARSLALWHASHRFCARCGSPSEVTEAGWKRACPACGAEHFPRTDPVAIMLPVREGRCLLGRSPGWPPGFVSCLAGFVEPGETAEQAAAREVHEEAGIACDPASARYLFSQPWPYASSLMMGMTLDALSEDITVDPAELEAAMWLARDEAADLLAGRHPDLFAPPPQAIAHHVLKAWAVDAND